MTGAGLCYKKGVSRKSLSRVGKTYKHLNMKKTSSKIISAIMIIATFALAITSCQKTQNTPLTSNLSEVDAISAASRCTDTIPVILQVPEGNRLATHAYATGVQIYQVQRSITDPNVFLWVFIAPSATLYARADYTTQIGIHYAGPTWELTKGPHKGEKIVGAKLQAVTEDVTAIPWLLLKAVDSLSSVNNKVTYIQRLCTEGGLAPTTGADEEHLSQLDSIPYAATYLFYVAKH